MQVGLPGFFKQQTGQAFLVVAAALWLFWKEGAPEIVLWMVSGLGGLYILGEKVRSSFNGRDSGGKPS